ncbi:MAG: sigma 54-interacting transcriptional regulator [bacterium]
MALECQECSVDDQLGLIVNRLAERPYVALARIWLIRPGDICASCRMREECPDQTSCLHLVASAGRPISDPEADWSRLNGDFRRIPLGVRKVGQIGATGEMVTVEDIEEDAQWIARPDWAEREEIRSFNGQPLLYRGEVLGVLAVFARITLPAEAPGWVRLIADHAAAAIANKRSFEEIANLRSQLELENEYLREEVRTVQAFGEIVGHSPSLRSLLEQIELVAPTDANVLILGESGTGKELVAREIRGRSARRDRPMIRVNCASIPRELYESEFFGHVKGAFTGAVKDRAGRFEAADGGTLFLDEVGELPLEVQGKLLRVLQEGEYERVGEERTRKVDVRIIAATNSDLKQEAEAGRFRQDLYYRLNVFPIEVSPLRRRKEDIPLLAAHFLETAAANLNRPRPRLTQAHILELQRYEWPGNIRELQNVIERAVITARAGRMRFDLPGSAGAPPPAAPAAGEGEAPGILTEAEMQSRERENTRAALERSGWKIYGAGGAAELLDVKPTTLAYRMKALGLKRPA